MLKPFGPALRLGVGGAALALVQTRRWGGARAALLAEQPYDSAAGSEALGKALRELMADVAQAGSALTIVVSDDLAHLWQVTPPAGTARMADLEAAAAMRFQSLFGAPAGGWKIGADWDAAQPFLAAALPLALLAQLQEAARAARVHIVEIVPQFVAAFNGWRGQIKPGAWFGVMHDGVLTLRVVDARRRLAAVRAAAVPAGAGRDWLERHVAREALRLDLAPPAQLQLCGPAPAAWQGVGSDLACSLFEAGQGGDWSPAARLACAGSRA